jgi:Ser/Thr protein kinase RdoA (MazF antagonist)
VSSHTASEFASLSKIGKVRRVGRLAAAALRQYDIEVRSVHVHSFATNLLYRVQSHTGERFMLRMAYPGWRSLEDLRAEAAWLDALHADTDIGAPRVIRSSQGEPVLPMSGLGVPATWYATLMTWVDGRLLAHYLTGANLERMGGLFARLHLHGKAWQPPPDFSTKRFEAFLSRGEPDGVFDGGAIQTFREDDRRAFLRAREWVEREYAGLDRGDLRVIHCDLWHENIKLDGDRLRPFDFEDTIWGYRLHDIAMGMLDLLEVVGDARYAELLASFRRGYEQLLAWPAGNLGVLQISRLLWKTNWVARFARESLASLSERHGEVFRDFERNGELHLPAPLL